jgi:hypothetical protein
LFACGCSPCCPDLIAAQICGRLFACGYSPCCPDLSESLLVDVSLLSSF